MLSESRLESPASFEQGPVSISGGLEYVGTRVDLESPRPPRCADAAGSGPFTGRAIGSLPQD